MIRKHSPALIAVLILVLSSLACEPVIAIGWDELIVIVLIIALLFGPLVLRFWRTFSKLQGKSRKRKD